MDGLGIVPNDLALCVVVQIFIRKGGITNCSCIGAIKLLESGMKVIKSVLKKTS